MTKNLLALLLALQKAILDVDQCLLLNQLGNKLEGISQEPPNKANWQNVQTKINDILNRNPALAKNYQHFLEQLQTWTDENLATLLPSLETMQSLQLQPPAMLGYKPGRFSENKDELENIAVVVSYLILKHKNLADKAKEVLPHDKLTANQPNHAKKIEE